MEQDFERLLICQCAPTMMRLKPANLFRYSTSDRELVYRKVCYWQKQLAPFGISLRILKECPGMDSYLIYMYREKWLERVLQGAWVRSFLKSQGYSMEGELEYYLSHLSKRLCLEQDFPHEIGIFLGYPLQDVVGFIKNKGENYTCCGYWKAYGDPEAAQKRFDTYRRCTAFCRERFEQGTAIIQLVVAA